MTYTNYIFSVGHSVVYFPKTPPQSYRPSYCFHIDTCYSTFQSKAHKASDKKLPKSCTRSWMFVLWCQPHFQNHYTPNVQYPMCI